MSRVNFPDGSYTTIDDSDPQAAKNAWQAWSEERGIGIPPAVVSLEQARITELEAAVASATDRLTQAVALMAARGIDLLHELAIAILSPSEGVPDATASAVQPDVPASPPQDAGAAAVAVATADSGDLLAAVDASDDAPVPEPAEAGGPASVPEDTSGLPGVDASAPPVAVPGADASDVASEAPIEVTPAEPEPLPAAVPDAAPALPEPDAAPAPAPAGDEAYVPPAMPESTDAPRS